MGLFNGYMKEGPGVEKDARKKRGIFQYIDIVARKWSKLMSVNCLYFLVSIPFLVIAYLFISTFIMNAFGFTDAIERIAEQAATADITAEQIRNEYSVMIRFLLTAVLFNFFGSGPAGASYAYITRCYTRGEHAWIFSDGWDYFKANLKQSLPLILVDIVVLILGMNALGFYMSASAQYTGAYGAVFVWAKYFTVIVLVIYMMMHIYIYQLMVTYECSFFDLLKNSMLIMIAKLPMSVFLTAVALAGAVLCFGILANPMAGLILYIFIGMILFKYPFEFYASRVLDKNMRTLKKKAERNKARITYLDKNGDDAQ